MTDLLNARIDVPCPQCGRAFKASLRAIQNGGTETCPSGHRVKLQEQGHGIRRADRAVDDFQRTLKRLNGSLRLRLR